MDKICHKDGACPFAQTEESEYAQNTGCLPSPYEIMVMRIQYGKTWACHSDTSKPCQGAIRHLKRNNEDASVIDPNLITEESDWGILCKPNQKTSDYIKNKIWKY